MRGSTPHKFVKARWPPFIEVQPLTPLLTGAERDRPLFFQNYSYVFPINKYRRNLHEILVFYFSFLFFLKESTCNFARMTKKKWLNCNKFVVLCIQVSHLSVREIFFFFKKWLIVQGLKYIEPLIYILRKTLNYIIRRIIS